MQILDLLMFCIVYEVMSSIKLCVEQVLYHPSNKMQKHTINGKAERTDTKVATGIKVQKFRSHTICNVVNIPSWTDSTTIYDENLKN